MTKPGKALGVTTRYILVSNLKPCQAIKKTCLCCMLRWEGSAVYGWDRYERMH